MRAAQDAGRAREGQQARAKTMATMRIPAKFRPRSVLPCTTRVHRDVVEWEDR